MSQCFSTNHSKKKILKSNSTVCGTDDLPIKRLISIAKAQKKTINKKNDVLFIKKKLQNQLFLNNSKDKIYNNLLFCTNNGLNKTIIVFFFFK